MKKTTNSTITGFDHLQISFPSGRLADALHFYVELLGFERVAKPAELSPSGAWLKQSGFNLHLGEEENFVTDGRGHPAFTVNAIEPLLQRLESANCRIRRDHGPTGFIRASTWDPFGNRIELMQCI